MHGFYRISTCVPRLKVADVRFNLEEMKRLAALPENRDTAVLLFPELAVTGYSCADLFHNSALLDAAERGVAELAAAFAGNTITALGAPVRFRGRLFNAAVLIQNGRILGVVPKLNLPNYREFYEKRYFSSGRDIRNETFHFAGFDGVPFGADLIFDVSPELRIGAEICEDMWATIPPSSQLALNGATLLLNLSASNELVGKAEYRRELIRSQSARCVAAYAYVSAGVHESTTDTVCGGHAVIAENGTVVMESGRFFRDGRLFQADIDLQRICAARLSDSPYANSVEMNTGNGYRMIPAAPVPEPPDLRRTVQPHPFVPQDNAVRNIRCEEIFAIQSAGLARRIEHTSARKLVIGISGGLDSTLALLVCVNTLKLLNRPADDVIAVTMPGFGTTDRTYNNAVGLCRQLGTGLREICIREACLEHFRNIGHDPEEHNVVYENSQARERTQILLDIANKENGIAIGTGDLSESAMGWCTYNGDHISMYSVNCSVPKTLIRYVIGWVGDNSAGEVRTILQDIIDTPVSPELLPAAKDGTIKQKTEDIIGPYEIHDFFLYHFLKYGAAPDKLLFLAEHAFAGTYSGVQIGIWLKTFLRRFFTQQFKRSCSPDGPKVGTISLSPRGDWRMPSDASAAVWFENLNGAENL